MITSFRHRGLRELFQNGRSSRVQRTLWTRCLRRLDALDQAANLRDLNVPGFDFHRLHGRPVRHSIHGNGPWCITFAWAEGDAYRVNLEQYH